MTFEQAFEYYGRDMTAMAYKLNVTTATLYNWQRSGIPQHRQYGIQALTKNKLKADKEDGR